jgi:hypothetical protein
MDGALAAWATIRSRFRPVLSAYHGEIGYWAPPRPLTVTVHRAIQPPPIRLHRRNGRAAGWRQVGFPVRLRLVQYRQREAAAASGQTSQRAEKHHRCALQCRERRGGRPLVHDDSTAHPASIRHHADPPSCYSSQSRHYATSATTIKSTTPSKTSSILPEWSRRR